MPSINDSNVGDRHYMMFSGALETNRDFGIGYVDGEGRWHETLSYYDIEQKENVFAAHGELIWI